MGGKNNNKHDVLGIIGIIIAVLFGIPSLLSFIYGIYKDEKWYLWAGGFVLLVVITFLIIFCVIKKHRKKKNEAYIKSCIGHGCFQENWKNADLYVPLYIQEKKISGYSDKDSGLSSERKLLKEYFVNNFFQDKNNEGTNYCCLLGDSGSGKTSALVHLLIDYVRKYPDGDRPYDIRLYSMSMGEKKLWDRIEADFPTSKEKENCILLLDALDENLDIQKKLEDPNYEPENYFQELANKSQEFARVVVSCRQQLFDSHDKEPQDTHIRIYNGEEPYQQWKIFYLSPFDNSQIDAFLRKILNSDVEIKKAHKIINENKDLFFRPLILSKIKYLLEYCDKQKKEHLTMKEIYDTIILYWLRREPYPKGEKLPQLSNLMKMSLCLAVYMFKHNINAVNKEQYKEYLSEYKEYGIQDDRHLFRTKSLLNRIDHVDKFSHKSFFDYFLAYWFFLHPEDIGYIVSGKDVLIVYNDICKARYSNNTSKVDEIFGTGDIPLDKILIGLYNWGDSLILNRRDKAKNQFFELLTFYHNLNDNDKKKNLSILAKTYNSISVLHFMNNCIKEGMYYANEELKCTKELYNSDQNNEDYKNSLMVSLSNMAGYYRKFFNDKESAEKLEEEAEQYRGDLSNMKYLEIYNDPKVKELVDSVLKIASGIAPGKESFINVDLKNEEIRIYFDEETMRKIRKMNNIDTEPNG